MRRRQFLTICLARGAWKANDALYGAMKKGSAWLLGSGPTLGVGEVMNLLMQEQAKPVMEAHERLLKRLALYAPLPASVGEDVAEEPMTAAVHARVREMDQRNVKTTLENFKKSFPACVLTKWVMAHPNLLMWGAKHVRFNNHEGKEALGERARRLVRMAKAVQDRFAWYIACYFFLLWGPRLTVLCAAALRPCPCNNGCQARKAKFDALCYVS
jgi:hypothetical protein